MRPGFEGDLAAYEGATRYWLDVAVSPAPHMVVGRETVRYVNATGDTLQEVNANIREAIRFHLDGLREDGLPIPDPEARCDYVDA